ncbi:MAG: glucosamine-6-phosphate deaminase, partial [Candidatus Diapherotrites archaeon]|nr:glucosamine-6-phosphate deaminase [Candidatus Diapherotrites archaeon]
SSAGSITRVAVIAPETRRVNGKNFGGSLAPQKALTIGLRTIRENSGRVLLLADRKYKAKAVAATLQSRDFMRWPAVALRQHKNFTVVADRPAAARL